MVTVSCRDESSVSGRSEMGRKEQGWWWWWCLFGVRDHQQCLYKLNFALLNTCEENSYFFVGFPEWCDTACFSPFSASYTLARENIMLE